MRRIARFQTTAALSVLLAVSAASAATVGEDVKALLEQGKNKEAFDLGERQPQNLGKPEFDFFFGIAALDAGVPGEGVLALERYLVSYPDNRSARFQLARGYYILGEDQRAREEFETLAAAAQGEEKAAITRFLEAIQARAYRYEAAYGAYVELGMGWDSNINSGVPAGTLIPFFNTRTSTSSVSTREASPFTTLAAGFNGTWPLSPGVYLFGGVNADGRFHQKSNDDVFDSMNLGLNAGVSMLSGRNLYRGGASFTQTEIDNQTFVISPSIFGEWQYQEDQFDRYNLGLSYASNDYRDTQVFSQLDKAGGMSSSGASNRKSTTTSLSGGWTHAFAGATSPVMTLSANIGTESNERNRPDYSRDTWGLRLGGSLNPLPQWGVSAGLSFQESKYKAAYDQSWSTAPSLPARHDAYTALDASLSWFYDKNLSLRAEALIANNRSNIATSQTDRNLLAFKARYDFK